MTGKMHHSGLHNAYDMWYLCDGWLYANPFKQLREACVGWLIDWLPARLALGCTSFAIPLAIFCNFEAKGANRAVIPCTALFYHVGGCVSGAHWGGQIAWKCFLQWQRPFLKLSVYTASFHIWFKRLAACTASTVTMHSRVVQCLTCCLDLTQQESQGVSQMHV